MKLSYDPTVDALMLRLSAAPVEESDEVAPGIILDYDEDGQVIGIEVLDVSKRAGAAASVESILQPRTANAGTEKIVGMVGNTSMDAPRVPGERNSAQAYIVGTVDTIENVEMKEQRSASVEQREPVSTGRF